MLRLHFIISQTAVTNGMSTLQQAASLPARADRLMPTRLKVTVLTSYNVHTAIFGALAQAGPARVCLAGLRMLAAAV